MRTNSWVNVSSTIKQRHCLPVQPTVYCVISKNMITRNSCHLDRAIEIPGSSRAEITAFTRVALAFFLFQYHLCRRKYLLINHEYWRAPVFNTDALAPNSRRKTDSLQSYYGRISLARFVRWWLLSPKESHVV